MTRILSTSGVMTPETDEISAALFEKICRETLMGEHAKKGIGTLGERTLHVILKRFYEPDPEFQEVKVGSFVADIKRGDQIVEIQTRDFRNLRKKLPEFLKSNTVKVVFPVAVKKKIRWVDPGSGEVSEPRSSPKRGNVWDFLAELWQLRPILPIEGLSFDMVSLEMEEFKLLTGKSRDRKRYGAKRAERVPTKLIGITTLETPDDFAALLPPLPDEFTVKEFVSAAKLRNNFGGRIIQTLVTLGALEMTGKRGKANTYRIKKENENGKQTL